MQCNSTTITLHKLNIYKNIYIYKYYQLTSTCLRRFDVVFKSCQFSHLGQTQLTLHNKAVAFLALKVKMVLLIWPGICFRRIRQHFTFSWLYRICICFVRIHVSCELARHVCSPAHQSISAVDSGARFFPPLCIIFLFYFFNQ